MIDKSGEIPKSTLTELNDHNGASKISYEYAQKCLYKFDEPLYGVCMGIAYGGGVERVARLWGDRGIVVGYDTFEDLHPSHLAIKPEDREATCMDHWYQPHIYGTGKLSYEYQSGVLKHLRVALVKGEVHPRSCDPIDRIHYAFLDMDILVSMKNGYEAVRDKIVSGGYLLLHDVTSPNNLPMLHEWYENEIKTDPIWKVEYEDIGTHLAVLSRKLKK